MLGLVSLDKNFGALFDVVDNDSNVTQREDGLSHGCHKKNNHDSDNMESEIHENRSLFDKSEVET